ncbi:hypothetical protein F5B22DRAFT_255084 [Xylaria bambusicola]|uniref:uncharacterized protein n=1 Tax=Xylaria bambusicola TaxID=326684 RepID=UPI0020085934|nr:uncharacterized protein F5B22DRAFT_255084 [Xylaria bambusicola]KAI0525814.1 hypothetical protein F5B22DRAFT_255084 [Xylaria bambusicola]
MSSGSAQEAGPRFLGRGLPGGATSSHVPQNSHNTDGCPAREQKDSYTFLQQEVRRLRRQNTSLENELREQRTNYNLLAGDMLRICDELRQLLDERDRERAHDVRGTGPQNLSGVLRNRQDVK